MFSPKHWVFRLAVAHRPAVERFGLRCASLVSANEAFVWRPRAGMLVAMAFTPLGHFLTVPLETRFPPPPENLAPVDGVIVLVAPSICFLAASLTASFSRLRRKADCAARAAAPFPKARLVFTAARRRNFALYLHRGRND